jgi:hypothetical protein
MRQAILSFTGAMSLYGEFAMIMWVERRRTAVLILMVVLFPSPHVNAADTRVEYAARVSIELSGKIRLQENRFNWNGVLASAESGTWSMNLQVTAVDEPIQEVLNLFELGVATAYPESASLGNKKVWHTSLVAPSPSTPANAVGRQLQGRGIAPGLTYYFYVGTREHDRALTPDELIEVLDVLFSLDMSVVSK